MEYKLIEGAPEDIQYELNDLSSNYIIKILNMVNSGFTFSGIPHITILLTVERIGK